MGRFPAYKLTSSTFLLFSFFTALLTSLPGIFFRNSLDWDEDVFQYVTQRIVFHFELPYTTTFENKPPLAYLMYMIPVFLQAEDKIVIRLFASALIAIIAYLLAQIFLSEEASRTRLAFVLIFVVIFRFYPGGFTWLTELNGITTLVLLMYLTTRALKYNRGITFFLNGLMSSCVILTRTNLFIPVFLLMTFLIVISNKRSNMNRSKILYFFFGVSLPFVAFILLYLEMGYIQELFKGFIQLPIEISDGRSQIQFGIRRSIIYLSNLFLSLYLLIKISDSHSVESKIRRQVLVITNVGILLSIILNLPNFGHHLLQIIPTTIVMVFLAFRDISTKPNFFPRISFVFVCLSLFIVSITQNTPRPNPALWREEQKLIQQMKDVGLESGDTLWSPNFAYLYSRFRTSPITSIFIHPANLYDNGIISTWKGRTYTQAAAVDDILQDSPEWLVFKKHSAVFDLFMNSPFSQRYIPIKQVSAPDVVVFRLT